MPSEENSPLASRSTTGDSSYSSPVEQSEILERIDEGFCALDNNFNVTYLNRQGERFLGRTRDDLLQKSLWTSFPEAVGTEFYKQYHYALQQQVPVHFESFFKPLNSWFEVNVYPSVNGLSLLFRNINERKKVEEELRKLSLIVQRTDNLVMIMDENGLITWVNDAFLDTTGYTFEEIQGKYPATFLRGPETDFDTALYIDSCIKRGEGFHVEILNYSRSGQKFWVEYHCQAVKDAAGKVQQFFSISNNITGRKELQQLLDEEVRLRQQMITSTVINTQEKERAIVSRELHDNVNQVLTSAKLHIDLGLSATNNQSEFLNKSMQLIQKAIDEIRNLSKRLSDPLLVHSMLKESVDELIDTVSKISTISISLDTHGIEGLNVDKEVHLAVYRILQEHLTNVLKHAQASKVQVILSHLDSDLVLKVTDDGIGFDTKEKRSGIGITNMTTRAESLGGSLIINSAPGLGCVLIARFPLTLPQRII